MCDSEECIGITRRAVLKAGAGLLTASLVGTAGLWIPEGAAAASTLAIAATGQWGARAPQSPPTRLSRKPTGIVIHHTDTPNTTDHSQQHAFALARAIQQGHIQRGWIDTGQHFTNSRGGLLMEGRHGSLSAAHGGNSFILGAHCAGKNGETLGIENEGMYMAEAPITQQWDTLVDLCAYLCRQYNIHPSKITGHRDHVATLCPGDKLYAMLPQLRTQVAARLGQAPPSVLPVPPQPVPPTATGREWPLLRNGSGGENVRALQYLLAAAGRRVTADGAFGPLTEQAVRQFQADKRLAVDGIVGQRSWEALATTVRQGSRGDTVKAAQGQLNARGERLTVDGIFGVATGDAVQRFQRATRLTDDRVVGPNTWCVLVGGAVR